jgi:CelD/BcsL family acetyltransferase involved in cellulose biosynthesis
MSGFVFAECDENDEIVGGIPLLAPPRLPGRPRRLVALPFTDALDPLAAPGRDDLLARGVEELRRELGVARVELRGPLEGAQSVDSQAVVHRLSLEPDPDTLLARCSKDKRRDVRASERRGLSTRRASSEEDLTEVFYRLHLQTRRRLGVPTQPRRFFRLLWRRIIEPGGGFVLIVEEGPTPIAAAVFLVDRRTVVYKYSASDANRRNLRPNVLLLWSAIRDACEQGYETFDFGRSELVAQGLREFKMGWGAVELPLSYSVIGERAAGDPGAPGLLASVLRRSPIWVTRATGELLYRYAA